jgi:uncharacterized protein (TIGR02147 family)
MWISEFKNYKAFIRAVMKTFPKSGRGQSRRLAEHLGVAPIVVSQILSRDRHFTTDQAVKVAEFFGFDEATTEYFIYLVSLERSDTKGLRDFYQKKLTRLREEALKVKSHVQGQEQLSEVDKGIFYSNWYYSAIRLLTSIEGFQSIDSIAEYFGFSRAQVGEIVPFLVATGLCTEEKGKIRFGTKSTHVAEGSPFVNNHRRNWREKATQKFTAPAPEDLFFVGPVSMSKKDAELVRKELMELIKTFSKRVADSPEEKLMCLNIDWFGF